MSLQTTPQDAVKAQELKKFFQDLLDETFEIPYNGETFVFHKRFSSALMGKIMNLDKVTQMNYLVSYLSVSPKITIELATHFMPSDLIGLVGKKITEFNKEVLSGEESRTSPPTSPLSTSLPKD